MFVGFTGNAFNQEKEFSLQIGQQDHLGNYQIALNDIRTTERSNHFAWISDLTITDQEGNFITNLHPEKRIYLHRNPNPDRRQPHSELDIYSTIYQDIYSVFSGVDTEKSIAYLKIMINPLVWWVWFGGWVLILGTMIALWPKRST
jgi:cytochrome c-type biogenesis protein CcmF